MLQRDYRGHCEIRKAVQTPIQMGENWFGLEDMSDSLLADASGLCMPDVMKIGGVSAWLRASALAEQRGMPMSSHIFQEFSAHLLTVTPTAHWLERMDVAGAVIEPVLTFKDGRAHISDRPGAGIVWQEKSIQKYLYP